MRAGLFGTVLLLRVVNAHITAWHNAMYCRNGTTPGVDDPNTEVAVQPLWDLPFDQWWFHHDTGCDEFPPEEGVFLELPAGGQFTVEMAGNRGQTTLSFDGQFATEWPDGGQHPENYNDPNCITTPNLHTQNETMAAGTAFAISYQSDITKVTPDNLVVFSVRYHTPFKRVTTYDVPAAMPACPAGGCICAFGWVPNGCGEPNMYHGAYKCQVTGATQTAPVGTGVPPVWCQDDPAACVKGPKQMLYWNQQSGNNIDVSGYDASGLNKSPAYNGNCGFADGAQNDIFVGGASIPPSVVASSVASTPTSVPASTPAPSSAPVAAPPPSQPSDNPLPSSVVFVTSHPSPVAPIAVAPNHTVPSPSSSPSQCRHRHKKTRRPKHPTARAHRKRSRANNIF